MKNILFILLLISFGLVANSQTKPLKSIKLKSEVVEIACGECKFKMKGKSCDLAIRVNGIPYFVDGKKIDDFGDAHDEKHGFCNVISKATVTGEIVNNRFKAKTIALLPVQKDK